jgi:hypothetical protein
MEAVQKMKKSKLNSIIPLIVYPFQVMVSFNESDEELGKKLIRLGVDNEDHLWQFDRETQIGRACQFKCGALLIRLKKFPDTPFEYGCLQHEVFHAVTYLALSIGLVLEIGVSDEAYAYLVGYLTEQIFIEIRKALKS